MTDKHKRERDSQTILPLNSVEFPHRVSILSVAARSFGVLLRDSDRKVDIVKNLIVVEDYLPTSGTLIYRTQVDRQTSLEFIFVENLAPVRANEGSVEPSECLEIGRVIAHFGEAKPIGSPVEIRFVLSEDGQLSTHYTDPSSGQTTSAVFDVGATRKTRVYESSPSKEYDAFICHASEDKEALVDRLAEMLSSMGYSIWYDKFELRPGDSLRQSIDRGLANCEYGIVVLSDAFFQKNWPQYELNGLTAREIDGEKVILPLWHNVSRNDILKFSPTLADKVAIRTEGRSVQGVADEIAMVLRAARKRRLIRL